MESNNLYEAQEASYSQNTVHIFVNGTQAEVGLGALMHTNPVSCMLHV